MEETTLQTQGERKTGEGSPGTEIHLQAQNKTMVSTSSLWRIHAGAVSSRNCGLWRKAPTEAGFWAGHVTRGGCCTLEHSVPGGLHPMERTHAGAVSKRLTEAEKEQQRQGVMN